MVVQELGPPTRSRSLIGSLNHLLANGPATEKELASALNLPLEVVRSALGSLSAGGLLARPLGSGADKRIDVKEIVREASREVLPILDALPDEVGREEWTAAAAQLLQVLRDHVKRKFERAFDMTLHITPLYFGWLVSHDHERSQVPKRVGGALEAMRADLGPGQITFMGVGAGGYVFEHERHPGDVFKVKSIESNRHFINLDLETLPTEELSRLLNEDKLLAVPSRGSIVPIEGGECLILRQAKGTPMDHLLKYIQAKGPSGYSTELAVLARSYVSFQTLLFNAGRINTDASITNHLIDGDGNFLLHDLDIVYPIGGIDWHETQQTSRRSAHNLVEFLFWFLASNLRGYEGFVEPFRQAVEQNECLIEFDKLLKDPKWAVLEKALVRYGGARFLGEDKFQAESRAVEALLLGEFPGAMGRLVASMMGLCEEDALSAQPGVQLSPDELLKIVAIIQADDFVDIVVREKKATPAER